MWTADNRPRYDRSTLRYPSDLTDRRQAQLIVRAWKALKKEARIDLMGYDASKKIKGKKRHILVDMLGLLMHAIVHRANIQDRDGGGPPHPHDCSARSSAQRAEGAAQHAFVDLRIHSYSRTLRQREVVAPPL